MRVNRQKLLETMERVSPGLTQKELVEQSSCVVFHKGRICTFNEEIACSAETPLVDFEGAVTAKPLIELLSRLIEEEIDVKAADGKFCVKGDKKMTKIRMEAEVKLPIDAVDQPEVWHPLDVNFADAINTVYSCASTDKNQFLYSCVHITENFVEACDRFQIARYPVKTPIVDALVRASSIVKLYPLQMTEIGETASWLHFRNKQGLVFSCRKFTDSYHNLDKHIHVEGETKVEFPKTIDGIVDRMQIFSGENSIGNFVTVELKNNFLSIRSEGAFGDHEERPSMTYDGPAIKFLIAPSLLVSITKKNESKCSIAPGKLFVDNAKFFYCTCTTDPNALQVVEEKKEDQSK